MQGDKNLLISLLTNNKNVLIAKVYNKCIGNYIFKSAKEII
jgi:hypothetical protein